MKEQIPRGRCFQRHWPWAGQSKFRLIVGRRIISSYSCRKTITESQIITKEKEASTGVWALLWLFLASVLLPPFGLGLTIRYLKSTDNTAKVMGIISLVLTVMVLGLAAWSTIAISKNINRMMNQQQYLPGGEF